MSAFRAPLPTHADPMLTSNAGNLRPATASPPVTHTGEPLFSVNNVATTNGDDHHEHHHHPHHNYSRDVATFASPTAFDSHGEHNSPSHASLRSLHHGSAQPRASAPLLNQSSKTSSGNNSSSASRLLGRLICCSSRVLSCLRASGFLKDDGGDQLELTRLLVCACAAIAVLLVFLLIAVGLIIFVFVDLLPEARWQAQQTSTPHLDFNALNANTTHPRGHVRQPGDGSPFDIKRILAASGIKEFLQKAHQMEELRRRVLRNQTLQAALRRAAEKARVGAAGDFNHDVGDILSLAQTLPELELLSLQLLHVSAYLQAIHAHDNQFGLVELSNFLLNVKGRPAALERAAAHARAEAVNATTPSLNMAEVIVNATGMAAAAAGRLAEHDAVAEWNAALKTVFAGLPEATRLRAQLRGFVGVSSGEAERLTRQPFDDLAVLQYRHAWAASEVLPRMAAQPEGGVTAYDVTAYDVANRAALKADVYAAASIHNHVYFHPLRRYAAVRAYGAATVADTDAWYSEAVAAVQARCGVAPPAPAVSVSVGGGVSLSVLSMPRLSAAREAEVTHLLSAADQQWMPEALRASAAVNTHTIFVSLASYRDAECSPTVLDMFRTARNPHRVYVGLAQQNRVGDTPCVLPEMYAPFLCPSGGTGVANALEAQARGRVLRGGVDFGRTHAGSAFASFDADVCFLTDHVRVRNIDARQAKGPTYGRYMAMLLYRGEDLTLVLDSHNKFRPMWDTLGSSFLKLYDDPKAALSHYPEAYDPTTEQFDVYRHTTAYLCRAFFMKNFGYLRLNAMVIGSPSEFAKNNQYNDPYVKVQSKEIAAATNFRLPQPWIAGGFLLTNATIFRDVPFDPHLLYVFDGEEILYSVRLWTHGYNIYSPPQDICFHIYGRAKAPRVWSESAVWYATQDRVRPRIHMFLQSHVINQTQLRVPADTQNSYAVVDSSRYGMGKQRTVAQWYEYAGADPIHHKHDGRWCGVDTTNM